MGAAAEIAQHMPARRVTPDDRFLAIVESVREANMLERAAAAAYHRARRTARRARLALVESTGRDERGHAYDVEQLAELRASSLLEVSDVA